MRVWSLSNHRMRRTINDNSLLIQILLAVLINIPFSFIGIPHYGIVDLWKPCICFQHELPW